ncbi:MAG: GNAT family N-acetyltransferase [Rhodospirillales bacterium]|nr:GNAT family N-acetyltransferase [Rhodospirillales bacterium]
MNPAIRPSIAEDAESIWQILAPVIVAGDTYALPRDWRREQALGYWLAPDKQCFVAELEGRIAGTYYLKANQAGGGAHVANCGYMTAGWAAGRGVARAMCAHSLDAARVAGFRAMQFNLVVSTNRRAIGLWQQMGFETVGLLPGAFQHPEQGDVDALVMYRRL